jgi:uncharacterized protein HemX
MAEHDQGQDPVEAAERLAESFDKFTGQLSRLHRSGTRNRVITVILALLVVALGYVAWTQHQAQRQQQQIQAQQARILRQQRQVQAASHASQITACRQANGNRAQDAAVWKVILKVPANAKPATQKELATLIRLVGKKDRLRNCARLYAVNR